MEAQGNATRNSMPQVNEIPDADAVGPNKEVDGPDEEELQSGSNEQADRTTSFRSRRSTRRGRSKKGWEAPASGPEKNDQGKEDGKLDARQRRTSRDEPNLGSEDEAITHINQEKNETSASVLSEPTGWTPEEGPPEMNLHRQFEQDGQHPNKKAALEVQGQKARPPSTSTLDKAGRILNRVFPVIHPLSTFMAIENLVFGLLVMYSLFSATYQMGFDQIPSGGWLYFETSVDGFYYIDCLLQFRVGYFSGTKLPAAAQKRMIELGGAIPNCVMDGRKVAWHYLTHWFIIDFISSFPFDIIFANVQPNRPWSLQLLLLVKLLRLPRFWRARSQLRRFLSQSQDEVVSLITTVIFIFFYCHVSGCIFWYIVKHEKSGNTFADLATWDDHGVDQPLTSAPPAVTYLVVLYFCIISFASVGYGDVHPASTVAERLWAIFNGACAAVALGYVVGKITSLVFARSERRTQLRERFDVLHRIIDREKLPEMLAIRMTQQLATIWESKIYRYNEEELQSELPTHLRAELLATWWIRHIRPSAIFPHYPPYLRAVLSQSTRQLCPPGDYIVHEGQISRSLYVVWKGSLMISSSRAVEHREANEDLSNDPEGEWQEGEYRAHGRSRRRRRDWTREKAERVKEWFKKIKRHGEDFGSASSRSDASDFYWSDQESDDEEGARASSSKPKKRHWEVGVGTVLGERALMNALAQRMKERGPDFDRIRCTSIVIDVTARSLDETHLLRILIDDIIIDDYPPLLDDLMQALKNFKHTPPGVTNKDT